MLDALAGEFPLVQETFAEASEALGQDLWALVSSGPAPALDQTENTQPAMLAAGIAVWRTWQAAGGPLPLVLAGHSLGEYAALVAGGTLDFAAGVRLAAARARLMQAAVPLGQGAMAAILGLADEQVIALCNEQAQGAVLEAVNFNAPGQVVIAGEAAAVERAVGAAKGAGASRALVLPVSVPSHCALMRPAAAGLRDQLDGLELRLPAVPVLHNVDVCAADSVPALKERLCEQLYRPVRWVETVRAMGAAGAQHIIECGPGRVLTGLNKRIDKSINALPVFDPKTLRAALEAVADVDG
jgi:[acyl-carrier-protein] S-malonyltransferase